MSSVTRDQIESTIKEVIDPFLEKDLVSAKSVKDIEVEGGKVTVRIVLGYPAKSHFQTLAEMVKSKVGAVPGVTEATVEVTSKILSHAVQKGVQPLKNVKNKFIGDLKPQEDKGTILIEVNNDSYTVSMERKGYAQGTTYPIDK